RIGLRPVTRDFATPSANMTTAENTIAITSAVRTGKMKNGPIGTSEATAKVSARMSAPWSGLWPSSIVRPSSFSTMVLRRTFGSRAISAATRFAAGSARPSFSSMYATSASDSSGRSWTSRLSPHPAPGLRRSHPLDDPAGSAGRRDEGQARARPGGHTAFQVLRLIPDGAEALHRPVAAGAAAAHGHDGPPLWYLGHARAEL